MKFNQFSNHLSIILIIIGGSVIPFCDSIICPDSHRKCSDDATCCQLSSGSYGCCPLPSAQCCSDGLHCCPNGTTCNDKEGTCDEIIAEDKHNDRYVIKSNDLCPDKNQTCEEHETCCKQRSGGYGCCPYKLGVCCSDGLHCCPHGTKCDIIHKECVRKSINRDKLSRIYSNERMRLIIKRAQNVLINDIKCPGGQYQCPDFNTCCQINQKEWGCCPLENAVCCDDKIHCCPANTTCTPTGCYQNI